MASGEATSQKLLHNFHQILLLVRNRDVCFIQMTMSAVQFMSTSKNCPFMNKRDKIEEERMNFPKEYNITTNECMVREKKFKELRLLLG